MDTLLQEIDDGLSKKTKNIAIISEYDAGREDLASKIECVHPGRTTRITLDSFVDNLFFLDDIPDSDIVIIENCHFLARRKIGGFNHLHAFINHISGTNRIWVTTWNTHSYQYLSAIQGINSLFPVQITLGPKNYRELRDFILSQHTSSVFYIVNAKVSRRLAIITKKKDIVLPFLDTTYTVPTFHVRFRVLWALLRGKGNEIDPDEIIFERLTQISNGNPGIALKIWEQTREAWEIRLSSLTPPPTPDISRPDIAYLLSLIISLEKISRVDLASITPKEINLNLVLSRLVSSNLISISDDRIFVRPMALASITNHLKRIRMVW